MKLLETIWLYFWGIALAIILGFSAYDYLVPVTSVTEHTYTLYDGINHVSEWLDAKGVPCAQMDSYSQNGKEELFEVQLFPQEQVGNAKYFSNEDLARDYVSGHCKESWEQ